MRRLIQRVWARRQARLVRYLLPVVSLLMALMVQFALSLVIPKEKDFPYALFYLLAIFVTAWFGGYVPGAIASLMTMVGLPLLLSRKFSLASLDLSRIVMLTGVSLLVSWVARNQSRRREVLADENLELERRVRARTQDLARVVEELETEVEQRKVTEIALRESEQRVDFALDAAGIGRWDLNLATGQVARSLRHDQIFGYMELRQEWSQQTFLNHVMPDDRPAMVKAFQEAMDGGGEFDFECGIQRSDGERRWIWGQGKVLRNAAGKSVRMLGTLRDITKRKRAEQVARESQARAHTIVQAAMDGVVVMDHEGRIVDFNPAAERMFEASGAQVAGRLVADVIIPPRLREHHRSGIARYLTTGESVVLDTRVETFGWRDGHEFPLELSVARMPGGGPPMFTGFLRDISARRAAEEAIRESEERFRTMADSAPVMIWLTGPDKGCTWLNRRWTEFTGRPMEQDLGYGWAEIIHPGDLDNLKSSYETAFDARENFEVEYRLRRHDGEWRWMVACGAARYLTDQKFAGYIGSIQDVTERKAALEALRESQARYQALADSVPQIAWTCSQDGHCDYISRRWLEHTGQPVEEALGYGWTLRLHSEDRDRVLGAWAKASVRGERFDAECRIRGADGSYRWFKSAALPLPDPSGRGIKWFGSHNDFDDHKQSAQKVQTQLERMSLLDQITRAVAGRLDLRSVFQVVVRSLEDKLPVDFGCICLYDPASESLTVTCVGVGSSELAFDLAMSEQARIPVDQNGLSRCVRGQLVYEPDVSTVQYPFPQRIFRGGLRSLVAAPLLFESQVFGVLVVARRQPDSFSSGECEFLRQLSEHVALAAHQAQIHEALQRAYDDLRQTQQAAMQQERLRALGQMASGIAHDINNALSPVALYTESLLESEPNLSARTRSYLETTQRSIEDVAETVARMREFYRKQESQIALSPVDLNQLVPQVVDLTRARWSDMAQERGAVIKLGTELTPGLPSIAGIESEIREALINLIFNAVDAMPEGGNLTVRTSIVTTGAPPQAQVEVVDTGIGMDEETRRRCLEPFFTTKGERGTGLGLPMVYGVTQRHNAEIDFLSAPGKGTTAVLRFPALEVGEREAPIVAPKAAPAGLHILIVDDDPLLIQSLRETLGADGHKVVTANGGQAGIDTFKASLERGGQFDAVITDLGMPYVDGRQVAKAIRTASPDTPVILLTGWGQRLVAEGDVPPHVNRVLNKPPKLRDLRTALYELTEAARKPVEVN